MTTADQGDNRDAQLRELNLRMEHVVRLSVDVAQGLNQLALACHQLQRTAADLAEDLAQVRASVAEIGEQLQTHELRLALHGRQLATRDLPELDSGPFPPRGPAGDD